MSKDTELKVGKFHQNIFQDRLLEKKKKNWLKTVDFEK